MNEEDPASSEAWEQIRARLEALHEQSETRQTNSVAVAEKLARRARAFRERVQNQESSGPQQALLAFSLASERYGLPLESVVEIHPLESFSPVPSVPDYIRGVVHFRGRILSLIDLGRLFGSRESGIADIHFYIVAKGAGHCVALAAGIVEDLLDVSANAIKLAPDWTGKSPHQWVQGIYEDNCVVLQLDAILSDDLLPK